MLYPAELRGLVVQSLPIHPDPHEKLVQGVLTNQSSGGEENPVR
jgi:hypothetical protein